MDSNHELLERHDQPQYPGEDTRPTSRKEIQGWYSYGFAAEVFVICGVGSFIPIALEQLSREQGHLLSDPSKPCKGSKFDVAPPTPSHSLLHLRAPAPETGQCIVNFLGAKVNTASFAMYTFAISVAVQAILIISISAAADHGKSRKTLLLSFALTGAIATMLFLVVVPEVYALAALLAIIANTCFGASFVLLNSFLPILVRRHPSVSQGQPSQEQETSQSRSSHDEQEYPDDTATDALLGGGVATDKIWTNKGKGAVSPALRLSTQISSYGIGIGYLAAVFVQTLGIAIVLLAQPLTDSTTLVLRIVLLMIGLWWLIFTIPAALWLRPRPGPPLPFTEAGKPDRSWLGYLSYSWQSLWQTVLRARKLKDMIFFLAAWFLLSDAIATISGTAVLFAKTDLGMKPAALALIGLTGTVVGVVGAFTWTRISTWLNLKPSQTIIACICLFEVIPMYGLLGFIPAFKRLGVLGLQQPWEMYPLGAIYGFVLGGLSSYCRSLFSELIPPGYEAAFYALYAITDKGSSVFGPAIVGLITDRFGEIRPAFVFLTFLIFLPLPLMLLVDVDRGKAEALILADVLAGKNGSTTPHGNEDGTIRLVDEESEEDEGRVQ